MRSRDEVSSGGHLLCKGLKMDEQGLNLKTPLLIDARRLRPILSQEEWDVDCAHCAEPQARFQFRPIESDGWLMMCSLCWLYESEWGKRNKDQIEALIADTEKEMGQPFKRLEGGTLLDVREGDRILSAVVALSRVLEIRAMMQRVGHGR